MVVLDGSFETGKLTTLWKRSKEQLESASICSPTTQSSHSVMPIFAKEIFLHAIRSLNVEIIQTFGEADRFIAHLATRVLQCPVLSNDSDFLIFSSVELVQLNSLDLVNLHDTETEGIRCKKFKRAEFLRHFGLSNDKLLPLCAALLGNDETAGKSQLSSVIDRIYAQVKQDKSMKKSVCQRHKRMAALFKYIGKERDVDQALDRLLQPVPMGCLRENARDLVQSGFKSYLFEGKKIFPHHASDGDRTHDPWFTRPVLYH